MQDFFHPQYLKTKGYNPFSSPLPNRAPPQDGCNADHGHADGKDWVLSGQVSKYISCMY